MSTGDNLAKAEEYFLQKEALLREGIQKEEVLLSNIEDPEGYNDIISEIGDILEQLQRLEDSYDVNMMDYCTAEQKSTINQLVDLMLALNKDATKSILSQKASLLVSMKNNVHQQKLAAYSQQTSPDRGRVYDHKK